jgi:hypothetical protein
MTTCENISFNIEEKEILLEENPNISEADNLLNEIFSGPKKKKKKDKDNDNEKIQTLQITSEEQELADMFDLNLKKRKKDKKDKLKDNAKLILNDYDPPSYTYDMLLNKLYTHFQEDNIHIVKTKNTLKLPLVHRFGSKKTGWINFRECCKSIDRQQKIPRRQRKGPPKKRIRQCLASVLCPNQLMV